MTIKYVTIQDALKGLQNYNYDIADTFDKLTNDSRAQLQAYVRAKNLEAPRNLFYNYSTQKWIDPWPTLEPTNTFLLYV